MRITKKFLGIINIFTFRSVLKDEKYRKEFYSEIGLINFGRLRVFSYFMVPFLLYQLYNDLFLSNVWGDGHVSEFLVLDVIMGTITVLMLAVTHISKPREKRLIKTWHRIAVYIYVYFHVWWAAAIASIVFTQSDGLLTYVIGVFSAATIFLLRGLPFIIILVFSLLYLYFNMAASGTITEQVMMQFIQMPPLIAVSWVLSRVMISTRMRSFIAHKEVEIARDNLDQTVKERTLELHNTNIHLKEEISERKKYERGLKREMKKAEEADRLKSVFLANMSHEIRTPLNGILGFGDLLETPGLKDEKKKRYIDIIRSNGQQLLKIIDDIMDISMIESNQLKLNNMPFRIQHLFPQALDIFNNLKQINNKAHIELVNDGFPEPDGKTVVSDPVRIQQVLNNLLNNAIKFSQEGTIRFGGAIEDNIGIVYVEDKGIGISPDQCSSIFERFRQGQESTSREYGGTGLGLSISKGIIDLLRGMIWVDLCYTGGARFCFSIPIHPDDKITSGLDLLTHLKMIEDKIVILTHTIGQQTVFMDCFINSLKLKSARLTISDYVDYSLQASEPEVIIIDLSNTDLIKAPKELRKTLSIKNNAVVIAISNGHNILAEELAQLGCHKVFKPRVNAHAMLNYIYQHTTETVKTLV